MFRPRLLMLLCASLVFVGCTEQQFMPPEIEGTQGSPLQVKKDEPIGFSANFDLTQWLAKTTEPEFWFKKNATGEIYVDWDADRKPFDLIVIHHSATSATTKPKELDAIQIETLYKPRYNNIDVQPYVKGLPIHSAHMINGKERFIAYHHLVHDDGRITTELSPLVKIDGDWYIDHVAWHSGQWAVNCRSIAICLVGNYTNSAPPQKQLAAVKKLINYYRHFYPQLSIEPHKKFNPRTECPGNRWELWSEKIIDRYSQKRYLEHNKS